MSGVELAYCLIAGSGLSLAAFDAWRESRRDAR